MFLKRFILLFVVFQLVTGTSALGRNKFSYIQFADKSNNPYSLERPLEFLSLKSLERRSLYNIPLDSTDLPVNPAYLDSLRNRGVRIHSLSKWMNGVTVISTDSFDLSSIASLPFVAFIQYTGLEGEESLMLKSNKSQVPSAELARNKQLQESLIEPMVFPSTTMISASSTGQKQNSSTGYLQDTLNYGSAQSQITQLKVSKLHERGYLGSNIHVAIIDGGFYNVDTNPAFSKLRSEGRLLGWKNIIYPDSNVYKAHVHGANVLSIMSGDVEDKYLGIAPKASYLLILSEYTPTEYKCEADFWVSALECADSAGMDIINSSLGYAYFDDPSMDFSYADLNGKVSRASRAATMASHKGIIVVVSAGNEGNKNWKYIGTPADAEDILSVGSVLADGQASPFSSFGPSADGRIKPDVSATGSSTALVSSTGIPSTGSGTSYSSPLICGGMACLIQYARDKRPDLSTMDLTQMVRESGSLYQQPDSQLGYGIPDFEKIMLDLSTGLQAYITPPETIRNFRLNADRSLDISFGISDLRLYIYSTDGRLLLNRSANRGNTHVSLSDFKSGLYILKVTSEVNSSSLKFILH